MTGRDRVQPVGQKRIVIVPYRVTWPAEFRALGAPIRAALGPLALRIDHIGSTAVPALAAKDIIDLQVTVARLEPAVEAALNRAGYQRAVGIEQDHVPASGPLAVTEWTKWYFRSQADRPVHVHVRVADHANQRYPLLFRDYLRSHPDACTAYAQIKCALARLHPDDAEAYYAVKDPVCDIIMMAAETWAVVNGWRPGPSEA